MSFVLAGQGAGIGSFAKIPRSLDPGIGGIVGGVVTVPTQLNILQLLVPDLVIHFFPGVQLLGRERSLVLV